MHSMNSPRLRRITRLGLLTPAFLIFTFLSSPGAVPPAEKLLPPDTLFVVSAPDWSKLRELYDKSPQRQLWDDPAMKPLREKFLAKWEEEFVKPLERDLGIKLDDYGALLQGQVTLAVTQEGWQGWEKDDGEPGFLLLLDARDRSDLLKTNLAALRRKWVESGKPLKTEKIRGLEFSVVPLTTNDVPRTLRQLFPQHQPVQELGQEPAPAAKDELVIGQHDSLLIVGTTVKAVEEVVIRLTGNTAPTLGEQPDFEASRLKLFRDTPLYGWFNSKTFFEVLVRSMTRQENPEAPNPLPLPSLGKLVAASGLGSVKHAAFTYRDTGDGRLLELFLAAPESSRTGITKLMALTPKDSSAPLFVPSDVVKFQRTRLDGRQAIATIEKMLGDISVEALNTWNFLISNGNDAMRVNDPDYDIRKNLFGNLGDDFISYEKLPRGDSASEVASPPSLLLIGSPNPDQLASALKGLLVILTPDGSNPESREFLGRRIFSVKLPALPMGGSATGRRLHYAASAGYVAFSTDAGILEEFLRSSEGQGKPLRDLSGLTDAAGRVGGQSTGWFTYENESEAMRLLFGALRNSAGETNPSSPSVLGSAIPFASPEKQFRDWFDFSLLPDFNKVSKYFSFGVYSGSANVEGLTFRFFSPTPPQLKN